MNKRDNRLKELKRLKYLCNEVIKAEKKKLKEIRKEERLLLNVRKRNK